MAVEILCWVNFFPVAATKAHAGVEVQLQAFFSTRLVWSTSLLVHHTPGVTAPRDPLNGRLAGTPKPF